MFYKDYSAVLETNEDASLLKGYIPEVEGHLCFYAKSLSELRERFYKVVDSYESFLSKGGHSQKPQAPSFPS